MRAKFGGLTILVATLLVGSRLASAQAPPPVLDPDEQAAQVEALKAALRQAISVSKNPAHDASVQALQAQVAARQQQLEKRQANSPALVLAAADAAAKPAPTPSDHPILHLTNGDFATGELVDS